MDGHLSFDPPLLQLIQQVPIYSTPLQTFATSSGYIYVWGNEYPQASFPIIVIFGIFLYIAIGVEAKYLFDILVQCLIYTNSGLLHTRNERRRDGTLAYMAK